MRERSLRLPTKRCQRLSYTRFRLEEDSFVPLAPSETKAITMDDFVDSGISVEISARPITPSLPTPVGSKTPPTIPRREFGESSTNLHTRRTSEAMEADALSRRLKEFESAGSIRTRERTPGRSPSRKRQRVYGDRYAITLQCAVLTGRLINECGANLFLSQIHTKSRRPGSAG